MSLPFLPCSLQPLPSAPPNSSLPASCPMSPPALASPFPSAGYLVTGYAIGIAVGGPLLAVLTKKLPRKNLILLLGAGFTLGQALCALAPSFELLLAARVLVSVVSRHLFRHCRRRRRRPRARGQTRLRRRADPVGPDRVQVLGVPGGTAIGNAWAGAPPSGPSAPSAWSPPRRRPLLARHGRPIRHRRQLPARIQGPGPPADRYRRSPSSCW